MTAYAFSRPARQYAKYVPLVLLSLAILAYAVFFARLSLLRYAAFESRALDLGNVDQAVWNTLHGRWFHMTNMPDVVNRLSLHVEPILIPISWLYLVYSGPETLLIFQAIVVALGALPLFGLARFKLQNDWAALVFALAFLLNPSIQAANWLEFHAITLAPTFILAAFYFLLTDRPRWFAVFAVLTASCKEEMALLTLMIGLYALVALRQRKLGVITITLSLLWAFVAVFVIQNSFGGNIHWGRYQYLGDTPLTMAVTLITRPGVVLAQLGEANALRYVTLMLLPVAYTALLSPEILLLALPSLGINLLSESEAMHRVTELMYAAPIVPFVLVAGVMGVARIMEWKRRHTPRLPVMTLLSALILLSTLGYHRAYGYTPWGGNRRNPVATEHHRRAAHIIAQIPPDARVSAQDRLNPHVSQRQTVYIFPRVEDADTVFLDVTGPAWPQHPSDLRATVDELFARGFGVAAADDGYLLLSLNAPSTDIPDSFYDAWRLRDFVPAAPLAVDFDDTLRLVDYQVQRDAHNELIVKLYWQVLQPVNRNLRFYVGFLDSEWNILHDTRFYPPVAWLWYPPTRWEVGSTVLVQTLPWTPTADQFTLSVGLYTGDDWSQTDARLPITTETPLLPLPEGRTWVRLGTFERNDAGDWILLSPSSAPPATPLDAVFWDRIVLDGVTLPELTVKPGTDFAFSLHWRTTQPLQYDFTTFAQLLDANGRVVAQHDWQPRDALGYLPTSAWVTDTPVVDTVSLPIPTNTPPGDYRLITGMYHLPTNQRLPVSGTNATDGNVVTLAHITVR